MTATETDNSTDSTTFSANDVSGTEYTDSHAVDSITRPESISLVSSDTSGGKFTLTTTDSTESTNAITGSFSLSETATGTLSNYETDSNSGLANLNTETGTTSAYSQESGNSILGSFTLSETSYTTTTVVECDLVGSIVTSATATATDFTSASTTGNDITGAESTSGLGVSSATLAKTDSYGSGDADNVTITTNGSDLSTESDNTITGSFLLSDSSSTTTTTYDSGTRAGNGYSVADSTDIGTVTTSEAGNEITGAVTATEVAELVRVLAEGGANAAGFPYTLSQQDNSTVTTTSSENTITGDSLQTVYSAETTSVGQYDFSSGGGTGTPVNLSYTELTFSGSTASESANTITGVYGSTTNELDTSTFTETGSDAAGTISVSSTTSQSPLISESGNTISGDYTFSENGTQDYTTSETDSYSGSGSGGTESWSFLETGSKGYSLTQSGSHVTGAYTLFENGADHYTISELGGASTSSTSSSGSGSSGGGGGTNITWGMTLSGLDNYTTNESGNELSGAFSRTTSGSGSGSLDEGGSLASTSYNATPSTHFLLTETGNYLSGALSFAESGSDRYSLIEGFTNVSNVVSTNGPGAIDFSPVGAPYHVGASPYWGHGPVANLDANAADAAFDELGLNLLHEYCWPAGAQLPVAANPEDPREVIRKRADQIRVGDMVRCRPDNNPHTPNVWGFVDEVFENDPARLMEIRTEGDHVYHPTRGHPMLVIGRGWTPAEALEPGDLFLCEDDLPLRVVSVKLTNRIERVYNFRVRAFHTYFVAPECGGPAILAHNTSPGEFNIGGVQGYRQGDKIFITGIGGQTFSAKDLNNPDQIPVELRLAIEQVLAGNTAVQIAYHRSTMDANGVPGAQYNILRADGSVKTVTGPASSSDNKSITKQRLENAGRSDKALGVLVGGMKVADRAGDVAGVLNGAFAMKKAWKEGYKIAIEEGKKKAPRAIKKIKELSDSAGNTKPPGGKPSVKGTAESGASPNKGSKSPADGQGAPTEKKSKWDYATEYHDKRATDLFGSGDGKKVGGREYDKSYKGKDIEYKSDNFSKGPRSPEELKRMETQMNKDIQNKADGLADPHWHFEHDPRQAEEMKPLLEKLEGAGIPWTYGTETPF